MIVMLQKKIVLLTLFIFISSFQARGENKEKTQEQLCNFNFAQNSSIGILSKAKFETDRLFLIPQTKEDHPELAELLLDYEVTKYLDVHDTKYGTREEVLEVLQKWGNSNNWVIRLKDNTCIGNVGFNIFPYSQFYSDYNNTNLSGYKAADIGYFLGKKFWKQGLVREACTFLALKLFQCFDIKLLSVNIHEENIKSINLAKVILDFVENNCGMKVKRSERKFFIEDGGEKYPTVCLWIEKVGDPQGKIS